jgi:glycosyltransferase involved in cell wall biosynthesis
MSWIYDVILLANTYNEYGYFLMPSVVEAFGMMAIESMACGKPILIFDGTALQDIVLAPQGGNICSK